LNEHMLNTVLCTQRLNEFREISVEANKQSEHFRSHHTNVNMNNEHAIDHAIAHSHSNFSANCVAFHLFTLQKAEESPRGWAPDRPL
jgi:hypothetical protein